jgi:hypothetical protein
MQEACYCGRTGEVEDRKPIADDEGAEALECRGCGHLEHLRWLPAEARELVPARGEVQGPRTAEGRGLAGRPAGRRILPAPPHRRETRRERSPERGSEEGTK